MTQLLIGIAGPTASGKTSVAEYLERTHNAWRARYSQVIAATATERGIPHDKMSLQHLSTELRATLGEDYLTKQMRELVLKETADIIVIEGNRRMGDMRLLESLNEETGRTLILLYIDAEPEVRFARMNTRLVSEGQSPLTIDEFNALENDECEEELPLVQKFIKERGTIIDNTSITREELFLSVERTIGNRQN